MLPAEDLTPVSSRRWNVHRFLGVVGFVLALGVVLGFSWRVFGYYRDIRSGVLNPALAYTTTNFTRAATAFAAKAASTTADPSLLGAHDPSTGPVDAKITIVEFVDFGCPYSQEVAPIVRAITKQYSADTRLVVRNLPLDDLHPGAMIAAEAGGCAQEQGKFWEYYDGVYAMKDALSVESLTSLADRIGLDTKAFGRCLDSGYYDKSIATDVADATALGVTGTPTFFFNGQKVEGSIPFTIFNQILNAMRQT